MKKFPTLLALAVLLAVSVATPAAASVPKVIFDDEFGYPT
jgi:hypothetical protein